MRNLKNSIFLQLFLICCVIFIISLVVIPRVVESQSRVISAGTIKLSSGIRDTNNNLILGLTATDNAVNYPNITNSAAGNGITYGVEGSDTNINTYVRSKGTGLLALGSGSSGFTFHTQSTGTLFSVNQGGTFPSAGTQNYLVFSIAAPAGFRLSNKLGYYGDGSNDTATDIGLYPVSDGRWEINNGTAGTLRDIRLRTLYSNTNLILETSQTPASASATCTQGTVAWDSSFIYICVATDTWKRSAIATW